jgi:hypothetical protein
VGLKIEDNQWPNLHITPNGQGSESLSEITKYTGDAGDDMDIHTLSHMLCPMHLFHLTVHL